MSGSEDEDRSDSSSGSESEPDNGKEVSRNSDSDDSDKEESSEQIKVKKEKDSDRCVTLELIGQERADITLTNLILVTIRTRTPNQPPMKDKNQVILESFVSFICAFRTGL